MRSSSATMRQIFGIERMLKSRRKIQPSEIQMPKHRLLNNLAGYTIVLALTACNSKSEYSTSVDNQLSVGSKAVTGAPAADVAEKVTPTQPPEETSVVKAKKTDQAEKIKDAGSPAAADVKISANSPPETSLGPVSSPKIAAARPVSFSQCAVCHSDKKGEESGFGPNLFGIAGAKAGAVPGYTFSPALLGSDIRWNRQNLDAFIEAPKSKIPRTTMSFSGVKDTVKRKEIVDYVLGLK